MWKLDFFIVFKMKNLIFRGDHKTNPEDNMVEKRRFPRFPCKLKTKFNFYEGNPDDIDYEITVPSKGKGVICDISCGGALLVTSARVAVGVPTLVNFKTGKNKHAVHGNIVRTGLLKNNPTEVAQKMVKFSSFGDSYIAVEFKEPIELSNDEL
jgi:hypothetical protein